MSSGYYRLGANVPGKTVREPEVVPPADPPRSEAATREDAGSSALDPIHSPLSPREMGYTGDQCSNCSGVRVRNNGTCKVCDDCGTTTGCS